MDEVTEFPKFSILSPWPTVINRHVASGHENYAAEITGLAEQAVDGDVFALDHPAVNWLRKTIDARIKAYFDTATKATGCSWRVEGRLITRGMNEFQAMNNRPGSYLTGVFCVNAPARKAGLKLRNDSDTNTLTLVDPRLGMNMIGISGDPYTVQIWKIPAEPGLMTMWPGYINHWMTPNQSDEPFVLVRFDVLIGEGDDKEEGHTTWNRLAVLAPDAPAAKKPDEGLQKIWPTLFVKRHLDDCEDWNSQLAVLINDMEKQNPDLTTNSWLENFFDRQEAPVAWLRDRVTETVAGYLEEFVDFDFQWRIECWPNINHTGDYHAPHMHGWCYLSGTYYLELPPADPGGDDADVPSGAINFADPRPGINIVSVDGDPYSKPQFFMRPEVGTMLLWPSSLMHNVYPNLAKENRITISFNVVVNGPLPC
ncbi:MAG: hypothetical protein HQ512_01455 [Rhodospirillales bacterium]|nr:hypothetical protein [Rhodospirillales bacterium]